MSQAKKLLFVVTEDTYFLSHRLPMARAAQALGLDVAVVTHVSTTRTAIEARGIKVIPFSFTRGSLNPLRAMMQVLALKRIYQREKPDLVHHIAMKPVLYGALAARLAGVRTVINAFAGLGYVFTETEAKAKVLRAVLLAGFRALLNAAGSVLLLQNKDDAEYLRAHGVGREEATVVIPGSGVALGLAPPYPPSPPFIVAFAGRMIAIKGLPTLKDAFALLESRAPLVRLWLCGTPDPANPGAWTKRALRDWAAKAPNVEYRGACNMAEIWPQVHAAVQPSWGGEGVPKSLLEAMAMGRAIVTTDVPGCRDVVVDGSNGYVVPPRDAAALADAIERLAATPFTASVMGHESRALVEDKGFGEADVQRATEALYRRCLTGSE